MPHCRETSGIRAMAILVEAQKQDPKVARRPCVVATRRQTRSGRHRHMVFATRSRRRPYPACRGRKRRPCTGAQRGAVRSPRQPQLRVLAYPYKGYWSPADTVKERAQLEEMHQRGNCPWMIWDPERSGIAAPVSSPAPALATKDRFRGTCRSGRVSWRGCARGRWRRSRRRGSAAVPASTETANIFRSNRHVPVTFGSPGKDTF